MNFLVGWLTWLVCWNNRTSNDEGGCNAQTSTWSACSARLSHLARLRPTAPPIKPTWPTCQRLAVYVRRQITAVGPRRASVEEWTNEMAAWWAADDSGNSECCYSIVSTQYRQSVSQAALTTYDIRLRQGIALRIFFMLMRDLQLFYAFVNITVSEIVLLVRIIAYRWLRIVVTKRKCLWSHTHRLYAYHTVHLST